MTFLLTVSLIVWWTGTTDAFHGIQHPRSLLTYPPAISGIPLPISSSTVHNHPRHHRHSSSIASTSTAAQDAPLMPGIKAIDQGNSALLEQLDALRDKPDLRFYSVDILASCEYMPQELFECYSETCEIYPVDEEEVSQMYRVGHASERIHKNRVFICIDKTLPHIQCACTMTGVQVFMLYHQVSIAIL
jgi:hypothetical protein